MATPAGLMVILIDSVVRGFGGGLMVILIDCGFDGGSGGDINLLWLRRRD